MINKIIMIEKKLANCHNCYYSVIKHPKNGLTTYIIVISYRDTFINDKHVVQYILIKK